MHFFKPNLGLLHYDKGMFSCLWLQSSNSLWNCHVFFNSQKQMQQQRSEAPVISRGLHSCRGSFGTGLLHKLCVNTCMHVEFPHRRWKTNTCTHAGTNTNTNTPPTPTCHMLSGFHVLCPNFWLVPTSELGVLVYFLAPSKYFTRSVLMVQIWVMHGRHLVIGTVNNLQFCNKEE